VKERCDLEFPAMPGFLKTIITCLLLESGATVNGAAGSKRFYPPAKEEKFTRNLPISTR
jgi:hypothetical protein